MASCGVSKSAGSPSIRGAVLAEQDVDGAAVDFEVDLVVGEDTTREPLGDAVQMDCNTHDDGLGEAPAVVCM
jgi:hypothetical protein